MDKSSEANLNGTGHTIDQESTPQQPSHSAIADKDQQVNLQEARGQKKISASKPKEPSVAASTSSMTTRSKSKKVAKISRLPADVTSRRSTSLSGSANSLYTTVSAKARKAILESRLKAEKEINAMKQKQAAARHAFELQQIAHKQRLQQEKFQLQRFHENQEMKFNQELSEAKLEAELNETIAEISASNDSDILEDQGANHDKPNLAITPNLKTLPLNTDSAECEAGADNVNLGTDDVKFNTDNVNFSTGADNVNSGADNVNSGDDNVDSGADSVNSGDDNVNSGADNVNSGADNVNSGADNVNSGAENVQFYTANALNDNAVLTSSATLSNMHEVSPVANVDLAPKCLTTVYSQANPNCSIQNVSCDVVSQSPFLPASSLSSSHSANPVCSNVSYSRSPQMTVTNPNLQQGVVPNVIVNQSPVLDMKPPVFDGNPINYCSFIDAFDTIIDCVVVEPKRRLFFLLQYTIGAAHTLVEGCQYMPADQGYQTARKLLRDNFGQKKLLPPVLIL